MLAPPTLLDGALNVGALQHRCCVVTPLMLCLVSSSPWCCCVWSANTCSKCAAVVPVAGPVLLSCDPYNMQHTAFLFCNLSALLAATVAGRSRHICVCAVQVGLVQADMTPETRRAAYTSDITYVTNSELGFDYLRDNLAGVSERHEMNGCCLETCVGGLLL